MLQKGYRWVSDGYQMMASIPGIIAFVHPCYLIWSPGPNL